MLLTVQHDTVYDYEYPVETAHHTVHLQPRPTACQSIEAFALDVHPTAAHLRQALDAFGNHQAWWSYAQAHTQLRVCAHSRISTPSARSDDCCEGSGRWRAKSSRRMISLPARSTWRTRVELIRARNSRSAFNAWRRVGWCAISRLGFRPWVSC